MGNQKKQNKKKQLLSENDKHKAITDYCIFKV